MKVYLDGQEYFSERNEKNEKNGKNENNDPASILRAIKTDTIREGRVITHIQADDVPMDEEAFAKITGGLTASFSTQPVRELIRESLSEALNYIPRLTKGFTEIALHFELDETAAGQAKLADAAEGLDWLLSVVQNCGTLMDVTEDTGFGLEDLKVSLSDSVDSLGTLHEERKYPEMASCIRSKLMPDIEKLHLYAQKLHELGASTQ